jgi:hypothetical protein
VTRAVSRSWPKPVRTGRYGKGDFDQCVAEPDRRIAARDAAIAAVTVMASKQDGPANTVARTTRPPKDSEGHCLRDTVRTGHDIASGDGWPCSPWIGPGRAAAARP